MRGLLVALVVGAGGCGASAATEVVVVVRSDLPATQLQSVRISATKLDGGALSATAPFSCVCVGDAEQCKPLPLSLGLVAESETNRAFRVVAEGYADGACATPVLSQSATLRFSPGRRLDLELSLLSDCLGVTCPAGTTCVDRSGECVGDGAPDLPTFTAEPPDAGAPVAVPTPFVITDLTHDQALPAVASESADAHLVVWLNRDWTGGVATIQAARVANGAVLGSVVVVSDAGSMDSQLDPAAAFHAASGQYLAAWGSGAAMRWRVAGRTGGFDQLQSGFHPLVPAPTGVAAVATADGFRLLGTTDTDVVLVSVLPDGSRAAALDAAPTASGRRAPALAYAPGIDVGLAVWEEGTPTAIHGTLFDSTGRIAAFENQVIEGGVGQDYRHPAVAFDGAKFLVASATGDGKLRFRNVAPGGAVDTTPVVLASAGSSAGSSAQPALAFRDGRYVAAWTRTSPGEDLGWARFASVATAASLPFVLAPAPRHEPALSSNTTGNGLLVWAELRGGAWNLLGLVQ